MSSREITDNFILDNWFDSRTLFGRFKEEGHAFYTAAINPQCFKKIDSSIRKISKLNGGAINSVLELGPGAFPYVVRLAEEIELNDLVLVDLVEQVKVIPPDECRYEFISADVNHSADNFLEGTRRFNLVFCCELFTHIEPLKRQTVLGSWGKNSDYILVIDRCDPEYLKRLKKKNSRVEEFLSDPNNYRELQHLVDPEVITRSVETTHDLLKCELLVFKTKNQEPDLINCYFFLFLKKRA